MLFQQNDSNQSNWLLIIIAHYRVQLYSSEPHNGGTQTITHVSPMRPKYYNNNNNFTKRNYDEFVEITEWLAIWFTCTGHMGHSPAPLKWTFCFRKGIGLPADKAKVIENWLPGA